MPPYYLQPTSNLRIAQKTEKLSQWTKKVGSESGNQLFRNRIAAPGAPRNSGQKGRDPAPATATNARRSPIHNNEESLFRVKDRTAFEIKGSIRHEFQPGAGHAATPPAGAALPARRRGGTATTTPRFRQREPSRTGCRCRPPWRRREAGGQRDRRDRYSIREASGREVRWPARKTRCGACPRCGPAFR